MMNLDGTRNDYDLDQLKQVQKTCHVRLVTSDNASSHEHFLAVLRDLNVDSALATSVFHNQIINISELRKYLSEQNVEIKMC